MKRFRKSAIALVLALLMALQGTEPIFVQAKEAIEDVQKNADFSRPEALTEEEAGITDSTSGEQDKSQQSDADVQNETTPSEDTETQEEQTTPAEETEENPQEKEVELKEPQDYYPIPEEPEGELIDYDAISKTYKTGDKQYTTVYGGYVGTYKNEDGDTELVDNTLVKPEEADTPASEEAQEASSVVATEEKEEKTEVYQNKANDYAILLPEQMSEENGVTIENGKTRIGIIPVDGDYTHSVIKDNAILYNEVYEGADVQYTVLDSSIKEDIVLQQPTDREVYEYELQIPGYQAEVKDNQVYIYPEGKTIKDAKYLLETPSMEDAAGEISFLITLELREEDGKTILTVKPDRDWLSAEERQYPVRIDPTPVEIQKSSFNMIGVEEGSPTSQIGDNNYPYVGFDDGIKSGNLAGFGTAHQNCRTYIKVNSNFSQIPKDSKIDSATFAVSQKTAYSGGASQFGLYRVDQSWNTSITWKTKPVNLTFQDVQNASTSRNSYINYDVKDLVNDWVQGTHANNGFALVAIAEANNLGASMQCEVLNNRASVYGPKLSIQWSPAEDPYLRDMSLDETTILLRPMTEKNTNGKLKFDAVFADGIAKSKSTVEYYLLPDEENEEHHETDAKPLYSYPDSTEYNKQFPEANKYYSKDSNWQSALYSGLTKDKLYKIKAKASKEIDGKLETGKEVTSDSFVIYEVKQFDTFPKIAKYYGVPLKNIMKDNQVMDALVVANNTIFIRNPQTNVPYSPAPLTDQDKMRIDGALMGRGLHCEFGFEPVNLNTGNFYMDQSDATMNELNGEFSITRSYNSKGTDQHSMFGRGWSFNYDQSLSQMEDGSLLYMRGDGSYLIFDKNEDGSYTAPDGYVYDLKAVSYKDTDHDYIGWELTDADQSVWSFDKYGILRYVTDVNGFKTVLDYDDDYNLSKITTPSGKTFGVKQDKFGHIKELSLPDGGKVSYKYDEQGNLISVTDPNGTTKEYKYDDDSRMTSWKDENGNTVVKNTYDKEGRVVEQTDAEKGTATFKYGKSSTTTTDNEGNKTVYHYDDQYRTTSIEYPDGTTCEKTYNAENQLASETTAAGTKTYTYDTFGNVATETREDGKTASYTYNEQNKLTSATGYNGATVTYSYDGNGNMVTSTKPDGTAITYTYDDKHRMVSQTDGRGVTTTYSYDGPNMTGYVDGNGAAWGFTYDAMNRAVTMTDPLGNVTSNSYDANGNLTSKTAADGGVTAYTLDGVGNITASTDALGNTTTYTYDKMYNMTSGTDPKGNQISYVYDKNYQQVKATDAKGNTITYKYDSMGRVIEESNKDFGTKLYEYDKAGNLKKYTDGNGNATVSKFDSLGQVLQSKDAVGNITKYEYDALGNETKITYGDGSSHSKEYDNCGRLAKETDELGAVTTYTYDAADNLVSKSDDSGRTWTYTYDNTGNRLSETNPEGGTTTYTYDKAGNLVSSTDEEGRTDTYAYDKAGNLTTSKDALGYTVSMKYDLNGNLVSSTDENGNTSTMTYDGNGNMTSVSDAKGNITAMKYDSTDNLEQTVDALKGKTTYEYDSQGNSTKMTDALGNAYSYVYDKEGNNTSIILPTGDKVLMEYDAIGQLVKCTDAQGLVITYQYDGAGNLIHSSDNGGNSMDYTYDGAGNVLTQTDELGRTATYKYDQYGRLLKLTEADGSITSYEYDVMDRITAVTDAEGHKTTFTYDKVGNQLSMTEEEEATYKYAYDKKDRVISQTNPLGASSTFKYDGNDNVTESVDENGTVTKYAYDKNDNLVSQTDGNGNTTTYQYDELDRKIGETSPLKETNEYRYDAIGNLTKSKDPMGLITEYKYDSLSNMTEQISPKGAVTKYDYDKHGNVISVTDAKGNETQYSVDLNDNVTKMTQANGGEYTYSYDKAGRLKSMTSPLGYTKNFSYDKVDNVVKESDSLKSTTTYTYDKLHNMKSSTNALDGTTSFSYDKYGNLVKETDPLGRSNTYSYDLAGQMTSAADPLGKITAYTYDPAGNITEITKPGGRKTSYGYDKNYNVTSVTDPMGYVAKTVYDKDNRVTEETDALGQKESYTYDKDSRVTSITDKRGFTTGFDYDAHGNIQVVTDKTGLKSHLEYDKNDNLTKVTDALGGVTTYGYDNMDNLVTFTNAANKTTNYTYDLEGNLTSIKDPAGRTEKFDYDEKGRLTGHTQASGKKTTYDYDKLNDLLEKSYQDAKGERSEKDVTYAYNSAGERVSMKDQTGKSSYEYDALGRITKVTSGSKKDVSYVYDDADNLQAIVYLDGTKISYEYDLNDNLVKLTDRNRKVTTYKHDALNRVTEVTRSNGTKTEVSYDAEDHITKIVNTCGSCGKVISTYEYKYNDQGYVVGETATELEAGTRKTPSWEDWYNWGDTQKETDKADCEHQEKEIQTTRTYEYDDNWELTRCTEKAEGGKKTVHNYTYDKIGNRTSYEKIEDGVSKAKYNYKYNDSNQLIKRTNAKIWGDPGTTYSYDKDGNLIQECDKTNSADPVTYEYTAENRLAVVKQGGTVLMAAMYDGDNNRVFELDNTYKWEDCYGDEVLIPANQRTEDGNSPKEQLASLVKGGSNAKGYTLTEYINDINRENTEVLAEYGADEKVRQAYTYGESGIGERVSVDKSEESSYYLYDGRNSVTGILTETANLTNSYQYDSYGNLTSGTADGVNYYGYNGESTNVKTGLQYLRARYYNAENGTFTTEDSDLGTTENPLTRNRYDYTTNNPLNYSDPTGHSLWSRIKSTAKKAAKAVKSVGKKIVNTAKKVVKTVVNTAKKAAKTIVNTVKGVAKTAKNAAKHAKQTYQSVKNRVTSSSTYQKITSRGSQFIRSVSNGVQKIGKTYTSFKSYVSERTAEIRSEVVRHMCTTTNRITDKLGKVDWNAVKKVAIGITAVTVSGLVVAATGGLAAGAVLAALPAMGGLGTAMVSGAVIGAIGGASYSAVNSGLSGNSLKQVAKDTLVGGIAGAVTGGVMGGLSYGAGKLLNVVRSAGSTHNDGIDKSFKKLVAEVTETKLPEGTWEKPPLERGDIIDKAMGNNLGHNFPTIDKVENGVVTSVKSRDLGAKTYQNGNKLEKVIVKDINKVSGFIGETFNGKFVNAEEIVGRQLQVVVPNVTLSEAQINAVNNATKHGIDKGVKLIITVGK